MFWNFYKKKILKKIDSLAIVINLKFKILIVMKLSYIESSVHMYNNSIK